MTRAIVNVAVEQGFYTELQKRVLAGCQEFGGEAELLFGGYPEGCPKHETHNYAFKVWAMNAAIEQGFRQIMWIDCRCRPVAPLEPVWDVIELNGFYVSQEGDAKLGDWCTDDSLKLFGIDRETARTIPLVRGGVFGVDVASITGSQIWHRYKALCEAGAFNGAHKNEPGKPIVHWGGGKWRGHVSDDPAVGGHRHDETALAYTLWSLGLKPSADITNPDVPEGSVIQRNR